MVHINLVIVAVEGRGAPIRPSRWLDYTVTTFRRRYGGTESDRELPTRQAQPLCTTFEAPAHLTPLGFVLGFYFIGSWNLGLCSFRKPTMFRKSIRNVAAFYQNPPGPVSFPPKHCPGTDLLRWQRALDVYGALLVDSVAPRGDFQTRSSSTAPGQEAR